MFLILCGVAIAVVWSYVLFVRPILIARYPSFFAKIDSVASALWLRSRTILVARFYWVGAALIAAHDALASYGLDWTPLLKQIGNKIPEDMQPFALSLFLALTGIAFEWLRRVTTGPVDQPK